MASRAKQGEAYRKAQKIASVHADLATTKLKSLVLMFRQEQLFIPKILKSVTARK